MRIAGYIEHKVLKITIFQMDNRFAVKFETDKYEQTYKIRTGELINNVADVRKLIDETFIDAVFQQFKPMHQLKSQGLLRLLEKSGLENEFENII